MMGIGGLLSSPRTIGMIIGGLALLAIAVSWYVRGQRIDALEARLAQCADQRAMLQANADTLAEQIDRQNAAIRARKAARAAAEHRAREAAKAARAVQAAADARIANILARESTILPKDASELEKEIQLCRDARALLVGEE